MKDKPFLDQEATLEKSGRVEELIRLYEERARQLPGTPQAAEWLSRAGELARDRLRNTTRAEELFRRALVFAPGAIEPLRGLKGVYEQKQDAPQLADILEQLAAASVGEEAAQLYGRAAEVFEQRLNRRDRAVLSLQLATRAHPKGREPYRKIRAILLTEHRFQAAFDSLERERAALGKAGMADEYAALAEKLSNDPTEHGLALKALEVALKLEPKHAEAEKLQKGIAKFEHTWRDRVRTLRSQSLEERDRKSAARLSLLVAKLFAWYDTAAAAKLREALDRCFLLWPAMPDALNLIERLAEKNQDVPGAVKQLEKMASEAKERPAQVDLWLRVGTLKLTRLSDGPGALEAFEKAAKVDPSRADATSLAAEQLLEMGKAAEAVALMEKHLGTLKDKPSQNALRLRLADLSLGQLNDPVAARAHLGAVLKTDSNNALAAFQLARLLIDDEELAEIDPLMDLAVCAPRPVSERVSFCEGLAMLYEERGNPRMAFDALSRALLLAPERADLVQTTVDQATKAALLPELASKLQRAANLAAEPGSTELWRRVAQLLEGPLERPKEAAAAWQEVLKREPKDANANKAVKTLEAPKPQPAKSELREQLEAEAKKLEGSAADPAAAAALYRRMLELEPDDLTALKRLGAACAALSQWQEVAQVAGRLAELSETDADKQEWRARQAQLFAERLGKKDEAAELYLGLLRAGVANAAAVGGLERLASQGIRQAEIARSLAPYYEKTGDYQRQVASLLVQLSTVQGKAEQKELYRLLATTHEKKLLDSRGALSFWMRGLSVDPTDGPIRAEAIRLARDLSAHAELARFFSDLASKVMDGPLASALLQEAAELAEEGGALDEGVRALSAALERSADDPEILSRLVRLFLKAGRPTDADEALRRRILVAQPDEKARLYVQLSELSTELARPREAALALEEAIKAGADEAEALPKIADSWEKAGRMADFSNALVRLIALAQAKGDKDAVSRLSLRRAHVLEASLGDKGEAIKNYATILEKRPSDPDALTALEHLLGDAACREEAARALLPAYESVKDHRKMVQMLDVIAEAATDGIEKVLALKQAAYIHLNHLRQPELAFGALARAIRLVPADANVRQAARKAAEDAEALDSYAEVLVDTLDQLQGPASVPVRRELAEVSEKKLDDRPGAVEHLRAILAVDASNAEALRGLQRLHRAGEEWSPLAEVVSKLAEMVSEPAEKVALWREVAQIHEGKRGDKEAAASAWRQIATLDPLNREAGGGLERLYTELDKPQELAFALEIRRAQEGQSPQGREITFRLAQLKQARLYDTAGALQLFRQILVEDPGHVGTRQVLDEWVRAQTPESGPALELIDPVLAKSGDHALRIQLREARMASALSEERARLGAEIRAIYERDLAQPEAAFMSAVKDFAAGIDRASLQTDLERLAKETGLFEDLAEIYEAAADELLPGNENIAPLTRRAAELREQLSQNDEAIRLWKDLLVESPQDRQALDALGRLYEASKSAKNLAEIYSKKAQFAQNPAEKLEFLLKAGTAQEAAGEDADAIESFRAALAQNKSAAALEALDRLFGKERRTREQADVLAQLAELSQDPEARRGLFIRRAQLLEKDGQFPEAADAYAQALEGAPQDSNAVAGLERLLTAEATKATAARLLEGVYRSVNDFKKLVDVLDIRLTAAQPERRLELINEIANLREATDQKALAFSARLRAFIEGPEVATARDEAERLAVETGAYEELAAAFEDQLERGGVSEPVQVDLWRRLSLIYQDRLSRPDLAARAWEEVSRREPRDPHVLDALARLYRSANAFKELAHVMRRQIALEPMLEQQVHLLYDLGHLAEESLGDRSLAAQCYGEVLRRVPEDANAVKALGKVLAESERWPELAQLIAREIQISHQRNKLEEMFELMVRLGRLRLVRLTDPRGALHIFQEILKHRPGHPGAVGALEEMARSDSPLRGEAATALEPVFESGGDHLKLIQMLESRVSAETVPQERTALLRRIAELYAGPMANTAMAFVAATKALRELPDDLKSLDLCLSLVDKAEAGEEFTLLLQEVVAKAVEPESRGVLHRTLAQRLEADGDEDRALENWKRAVELRPGDTEALNATGRLLAKAGRPGELLDILKRQLTVAEEPERRVALLKQIGKIQEEGLKDNIAALVTFRRLLEIKPDDLEGLERMELLCQRQERWPELADVLAKRLQLQGADADLELKFRLATVRETKLLDKFGAMDLYTEILAAQSNHPAALQRVEAVIQREPQNQAAVDVLLRAHRANGDVVKLAQLLETRVSLSPDSLERKQLLLELASLRQDNQGEPELAFLAMMRAFREDPNDAELRKRLEQVADAAKTYDELASVYEAELPRVAEAADAADVCLRLGLLLDQKLSEPERAVEFYEKARQLDASVSVRALPALDRIYNQLERWDALTGILDALIELTQEPQERVGLLFRLGQLAHGRLEDPDRAAAAYEKILEIDKTHLASARLLEQLYESAGNHDKLYVVLKLQRDLVSGPERDRVLSKMAHVSAEGLSDVGHSIDIYRELLQKNPRNEQAYAALDTLLERGERFEELKDLLVARLTTTLDPRELVRLNDRLGRVLWRMLKRPEDAIPYFKASLERDARHKGALDSLKEIYDGLGRKDDLIVVLRRLIPLQDGAEGVKALRIRLAEVLAELGRREEALDSARRSLEVEPHQGDELGRVFQIFSSLKAYGDAVRALELRSEVELGSDRRDLAVATLFEVADLWRGVGGKPESAGPMLERVLELDPANRQAYEQATALYSKVGDWRGYAQVVDRYLPNLVTEEEKLAALRELMRVQEQKLGQKDVAFLSACRALQLNPSDHNIREEVERLAEETESYDELAAVYEEVADELPRGPLAERMYLVLAKVQDQKLDDSSAAEAALRKILEFDPTNELALDALAGMFSRRGRDKEYIVSLEQKLEAAGSIEQRKQILRDIANVFAERIGDPREAASALLRAIDLEPDSPTLQALVDLYRKQGQWNEVANTLLRWRDLAPSPVDRARIQVQVAEVFERELGEDEQAIEGYRQALEFDPTNGQALTALERLYTKLDRPGDLLAVYERQLELTPDYRERVKVLFKSASIWEDRFQNLANADACIEGVLSLDPQNIQAIKTLERLRRSQERYEELVGVLERHIQLAASPGEQAELCVEMGDLFHQQLKQVDRAVATYHRALELNPKSRPAMHALGTLYERSGNWPFALDMLSKEAQVAGNTPEAVELYHRMGKINEDMLLDPVSARGCYEQALRIDPSYLPCIRALKGIFEIEKDWAGFERSLVQEAQETEDPEAKAKALLEVAKYYSDTKDDRDTGAEWFEESLKHVPDFLEAAKPLADIYIARENWEGAEKMLDIVARKMAERAVAEQDEQLAKDLCRQLYRLGYVAEKLAKKEKALGAYEKAYQLDATYLPALEGLGNLLVQFKRHEEALKVYQTILIHHRDDLTDLEVVEIYWQLGDVHNALKQHDRAQNHFEKALAIDPGHEPSLRALVTLADAAGKFDKAAEYRQSLVNVLDDDAKFQMCVELGILAREKLSDPYMAIDAYVNALKVRPDGLAVMDSLYVLYRETKQGPKAAELLQRMLQNPQLAKEPQKKKRVFFALGEISRDELREYDRALEAFNAALDTDYRFIEAFSAIEAMLGQLKQWKPLEENYARMIQRLPKTDDTNPARMTLWRALGDLYMQVLKQPDGALMAYQVVSAGQPDDAAIQETYAQLAAQKPGEEAKAVDAYRRALPNTTNPGKVVSALAEIAARRKDYDLAYMGAQVVNGLIGEAGVAEREILTKLGPYAKKREVAQRPVTDRLWQTSLFHPKVRGPIGELMAILFEQAGHAYAVPLTQYQINPKRDRIDVSSAQEYQIHHYRYVSRLLGMEQVELYSPFLVATRARMAKRSNEPAPEPMINIEIVHTHPVCLKVGGKFFSESGQKEVYYVLGRTLALLRPELALSQRLSAERLEAVFQAAISLSVPNFRFTADPRAIDTERKLLEKTLADPARTALARVTREYVKSATPNDLRNYLEGAELTAVRCGFFVAAELEAVKKMVMNEGGAAQRVPSRAKIRALMVFALSEDLHALRQAVGTNIEIAQKR